MMIIIPSTTKKSEDMPVANNADIGDGITSLSIIRHIWTLDKGMHQLFF
jgi:hypothetical protein